MAWSRLERLRSVANSGPQPRRLRLAKCGPDHHQVARSTKPSLPTSRTCHLQRTQRSARRSHGVDQPRQRLAAVGPRLVL